MYKIELTEKSRNKADYRKRNHRIYVCEKICTRVFMIAIFIKSPNWKIQMSISGRINKYFVDYSYNGIFYKNEH